MYIILKRHSSLPWRLSKVECWYFLAHWANESFTMNIFYIVYYVYYLGDLNSIKKQSLWFMWGYHQELCWLNVLLLRVANNKNPYYPGISPHRLKTKLTGFYVTHVYILIWSNNRLLQHFELFIRHIFVHLYLTFTMSLNVNPYHLMQTKPCLTYLEWNGAL